jgi:peptidyl-prolyl cis-trans isomerase SurA
MDAETQRRREKRAERHSRFVFSASLRLRVQRGVILGLMLAASAWGAVLDRIAVSVGNQVITLRDVELEIRVTAFLSGVKPDLSASNKHGTADRMVEQKLIRREMESSRFPVPAAADVEPVLEKFKKDTFPTEADYQHALTEYGITDQDVKDMLLWQRTLLQFVSLRFRPGVQVTDQQIQDYFDRTVAPAARAAHPGQPVALEDFRAQIEEALAGQQADRDMDNWLTEARRRNEIVFHPEALQ